MREHSINQLNNFICGWYIDNTSICSRLIEHHKNSTTYDGTIRSDIVDKKHKNSKDCIISDTALLQDYASILIKAANLYSEKYSFCNAYEQWGIVENINIQHYKPGGGFYSWHTERTSGSQPIASRHLVFMTYLNTLNKEGGETEFFYQKIKVKPEKGLTLIWGADWTFSHRGIKSDFEDKYITTGWFSFIPKKN